MPPAGDRGEGCHGDSSGHGEVPGRALADSFPTGAVTAFMWCRTLIRRTLATRTPFSRYLLAALSVTKWDLEPTTALFPLPLPFPGSAVGPGGLRRRRRRHHWVEARSSAVNVLALALNHVY